MILKLDVTVYFGLLQEVATGDAEAFLGLSYFWAVLVAIELLVLYLSWMNIWLSKAVFLWFTDTDLLWCPHLAGTLFKALFCVYFDFDLVADFD